MTHHRKVTALRRAAEHDRKVRAVYGLGPGDYERLYAAQNGRCAGCRRATGRTKKLAVDHDHTTGEVRGLLCSGCNRAIGHLRDDAEAFFRLGLYLINPPARLVLTDSHTLP